ncbi:hypothetical protein [Dactylococcopsis salina]|nr:hypothetical protein [Dactylococcopsis salina]
MLKPKSASLKSPLVGLVRQVALGKRQEARGKRQKAKGKRQKAKGKRQKC